MHVRGIYSPKVSVMASGPESQLKLKFARLFRIPAVSVSWAAANPCLCLLFVPTMQKRPRKSSADEAIDSWFENNILSSRFDSITSCSECLMDQREANKCAKVLASFGLNATAKLVIRTSITMLCLKKMYENNNIGLAWPIKR